LRTSIDVAEQIKVQHGQAMPDRVDRKAQFALADFGIEGDEMVKSRFIAEIIEARLEEIFEAADNELRKIDRSGMLPVGAVLTGGSVKLEGVVDVAKRILRLPCSLGIPTSVSSVIDEVHDPAFATAIGLAVWGNAIRGVGKRKFSLGSLLKFKSVDKVADQLRKWMKSLVP